MTHAWPAAEGLRVEALLHRGLLTATFRARGEADGAALALKVPLPGELATETRRRLRHEHAVRTALDLPEVPATRGWVDTSWGPALGTDYVAAAALATAIPSAGLPLRSFVTTGLHLARAVEGLHAAGVIHKDLSPSNVLYDPATRQVWLVDFECSSRLVEEDAVRGLEGYGTLGYMAPEQTGRTARSIDARADLYALGAVLYEALCGRAPFTDADPIALLHATLARTPEAPTRIRPEAPEALGGVVMKLLAKAPDERYQSASALVEDLARCESDLRETGTVRPFAPGRADRRGVLRLPARLFGRERVLETLRDAFERARSGSSATVAVSGPPGIGKTRLVAEVERLAWSTGGAFAGGKCDPLQRDRPYAPVLGALRVLVREALSWPEEVIAAWRARGRSHPELSVLGAVLPELGDLVALDAAPQLPPVELRRRLLDAIAAFLALFCGAGKALVLFLDDVQWADPATMDFIARALDEGSRLPLLLVIAARDGEPGVSYPSSRRLEDLLSGATVDRCALDALTDHDVGAMLAEALGTDASEVEPLASSVRRQTGGNPYFLKLFLGSLRERGALRFEGDRWRWDLGAVAGSGVTENVSRLLAERLDALPPGTLAALESAAALGDRLDAVSLSAAVDVAPEALIASLLPAALAGIVVPRGTDWMGLSGAQLSDPGLPLFRWPHDRVHQAAYDRVALDARPGLHLAIARRLRARFGDDDGALFDLVHHYRLADGALPAAERAGVARVALRAARRARASAAFDAAVDAYRFGARLIEGGGATAGSDLAWDLHHELAEAAIITGDSATVAEALAAAWARSDSPARRLAVRETRVRRHQAQFDHHAAVAETCEALRTLGVDLPDDPGTPRALAAVAGVFWRARGLDPDAMLSLPECRDEDATAAMRLLTECVDVAFFARPQLFPLIYAELLRLTLRHGLTRYAAMAFNGLAFLLVVVRNDVPRGVRFGEVSLRVLDRYDARDLRVKVLPLHWGFVMMRAMPIREVAPHFYASYVEAAELGSRIWAGLAVAVWSMLGFFHGADLDELVRRMDFSVAELKRLGGERDLLMVGLHRQVVACLRGETDDPTSLRGEWVDPPVWFAKNREGGDVVNIADYAVFKAYLTALFGDPDAALELLDAAAGQTRHIAGSTHLALFHFTSARMKLAAARRRGGMAAWRLTREARGHLAFIRSWEKDAPINQRHRVRLIEAELAATAGDWDAAVTLAEASARIARSNDHVHEAAVALECAAAFVGVRGRPEVAAFYLGRAREAWGAWGAVAKVRDIDRRLGARVGAVVGATGHGVVRNSGPISGPVIDAASIVRASHAISSEIRVDVLVERILRTVLEGSGARTAVLARTGDDGPRAACVATSAAEGVRAETPTGGLALEDVPGVQPAFASLVRRCARTGEVISVADAGDDARLSAAGERTSGSILVVPLEAAASRLGVLYLENPLVAHAFGADRAELVGVLASQGAVSLQNAALFADLAESLARQKRLTAAFERFLPRQFVEQLGRSNILDVRLGDAVERDITVMFADLRGFTSIAEALGAAETFRFINGYLGHMERAIHAHGGFVHQYVGDGIMAFFPRQPDDAVRGGVAMLAAMRSFRAERTGMPGADARVGIGVHTGTVLIGAIGGADRMDRGVVGDAVNLASRVEGLTRVYESPFLVSGATVGRLVEPERHSLRAVDRVQVKGRREAVDVYEALDACEPDARDARLATAERFASALAAWRAGEFADARGGFEACLALDPGDGAARCFVRRCREYEASGAPPGWSGVYALTTK